MTTRHIHIGPPRLRTAIQAVVWLGKSGGIISSSLIANRVKTHATFVRRIMTSLAKADIIASKGGRDGGYYLEKSPAEITLADIYLAVGADAVPKKDKVEFDYPEGEERLDVAGFQDALENILGDAESQAIAYLKGITIAQLMAEVKMV
ncbi:RrF2 family transcriptional regulator [Levilactobacillus yiduensis]|uniref:RrF2 family transcriptional regulator n=1 Tax=Levilactobacillus yiduensis TaxID=2953880 RepID=UPI001ADD7F72|nr:Rrf2 family transcriptional regulator [Levilactobacillus yiduensis]